jgi:hypothetical protein
MAAYLVRGNIVAVEPNPKPNVVRKPALYQVCIFRMGENSARAMQAAAKLCGNCSGNQRPMLSWFGSRRANLLNAPPSALRRAGALVVKG